jgi:hypothetical protein
MSGSYSPEFLAEGADESLVLRPVDDGKADLLTDARRLTGQGFTEEGGDQTEV